MEQVKYIENRCFSNKNSVLDQIISNLIFKIQIFRKKNSPNICTLKKCVDGRIKFYELAPPSNRILKFTLTVKFCPLGAYLVHLLATSLIGILFFLTKNVSFLNIKKMQFKNPCFTLTLLILLLVVLFCCCCIVVGY